jgi:hypothetical protein
MAARPQACARSLDTGLSAMRLFLESLQTAGVHGALGSVGKGRGKVSTPSTPVASTLRVSEIGGGSDTTLL